MDIKGKTKNPRTGSTAKHIGINKQVLR